MGSNDEKHRRIGKEVCRMIEDLNRAAGADAAYARRTFTFHGGSVEVILANRQSLVEMFERAVAEGMAVAEATPASQVN